MPLFQFVISEAYTITYRAGNITGPGEDPLLPGYSGLYTITYKCNVVNSVFAITFQGKDPFIRIKNREYIPKMTEKDYHGYNLTDHTIPIRDKRV